ncbi:TetR/AcrR family transcriptional regulator [Mesotoga prima]|uniref:TetR/AcrR family transcriptional regulator n=1 Tax=Mesotoga prima TaxID=1184387 RepID=UPI002B807EA1|nr:TetR/AcrR family transcriptional regulator [Mesotoga prima]HQC15500.1 TetR/AcrR family transcriptional regulator [Mesotoga prima]
MRAKLSSRERIIRAARKAFAERGHDGVSMSEIAQMAGVKKALIYYYFPSKEDLFYEVWQYSIDELEDHVFSETRDENVYVSKLKRILRSYIDFITSKNEIKKIMDQERANLSREDNESWKRVRDRYEALKEKLSSAINDAKAAQEISKDVDPDSAADLILNGFSITEDPDGLESIREIIWRGLVSNSGE